MCTLALYFQVFPRYPLVLAANRDEFLARPSAAPTLLSTSPWIYGGQDLRAGGTWLGINEHGIVAALLNRQSPEPADPSRRSRGLLCLDTLKHASVAHALQFIMADSVTRYNPFNLLIADRTTGYIIYAHGHTLEVQPLTSGVHLLTNRDLNDHTCPRIFRTHHQFSVVSQRLAPSQPSLLSIFSHLHSLLADHDTNTLDPRASLCLHLNNYGTCSSTLLAYAESSCQYTYHYASGPPCRSAYVAVPLPPAGLASHPPSTL